MNLIPLVLQNDQNTGTLDTPIYDGFTVLDSSKSRVYDFHYKAIQPECRDNIELLMTDGDRLIYERKTDDWYQDMYHMREYDDGVSILKNAVYI